MTTSYNDDKRPVSMRFILLALISLLASCGLGLDNADRLARGTAAYDAGEYRAAIVDSKRILQDEPENVAARVLLGRSSLRIGDAGSALKELHRAIELGADKSELTVDIGHALLALRNFEQVDSEVTVDLAKNEDDRLTIMRIRGDSLLGRGRFVEARDAYMAILAERPDDLDTTLAVVSSYVAEGEIVQARATLEGILERNSQSVPALMMSGAVWLLQRNSGQAISDFKSAETIARDEGNKAFQLRALQGLVDAQLMAEDSAAAIQTIEDIVRLAPNDLASRYLAAKADYLKEDWSAATEKLQALLRTNSEYLPAQMLMGQLQLYQGNLGQAEAYLAVVVQAVPSNRDARRLLAEARLRQNKAKEASDALKPIIDAGNADVQMLAMAAIASRNAGDYDEAIALLQLRADQDPGNPDLLIDLASALISMGRIEDAQKVLHKLDGATGATGYRKDALSIIAAARDGDFGRAIRSARELEKTYPDEEGLQVLIGGLLAATGDLVGAREIFEAAKNEHPKSVISFISLARIDTEERDFDSAAANYKAALAIAPGNSEIMMSLGKVSSLQNDQKSALEWFEKASAADPKNAVAKSYVARVYVIGRQFKEAAEAAAEGLKLLPRDPELNNLHGLAQAGLEDFRAAENSFKAAIVAQDDPIYTVNLANLYIREEEFDRARSILTSSLERHPQHLRTSVMLAVLQAKSGDINDAIAMAREQVSGNPGSAGHKVLLAELLLQGDKTEEASRLYAEAGRELGDRNIALRARTEIMAKNSAHAKAPLLGYLEARPADYGVRLLLAQDYQQDGSMGDSAKQYEKVVNAEPENHVALNNLAWVYYELGDARAESYARRAATVAPDNAAILDTLGWILTGKGDVAEGVTLLRKAAAGNSADPDVAYHLASALAQSGNKGEAKKILSELLAKQDEFSSRTDAETLLRQL